MKRWIRKWLGIPEPHNLVLKTELHLALMKDVNFLDHTIDYLRKGAQQ